MHRAERHLDVKFLWSLLEMIPAAEAASGDTGEADYDMQSSKGLITDALHSGEGALGEALRPVFIEYLREHPDACGTAHPPARVHGMRPPQSSHPTKPPGAARTPKVTCARSSCSGCASAWTGCGA